MEYDVNKTSPTVIESKTKRRGSNKVLETAVFLDSEAYRKFSSYFSSIGETFHCPPHSAN